MDSHALDSQDALQPTLTEPTTHTGAVQQSIGLVDPTDLQPLEEGDSCSQRPSPLRRLTGASLVGKCAENPDTHHRRLLGGSRLLCFDGPQAGIGDAPVSA